MPGALNLIQGGRWDQLLRRLFSMKQGAVAPTISPEIVSNIILENDRPENLALAGVRLGMGSSSEVAAAGEFSMCQLWNPVNSQTLVVCTSCIFSSADVSTAQLRLTNIELSDPDQGTKTDWRLIDAGLGSTARTTAQVRSETAAGMVGHLGVLQVIQVLARTKTEMIWPGAVILKPGSGLYTVNPTVNTQNYTSWKYYERALNASEEFVR
jgi:hypothetical protein